MCMKTTGYIKEELMMDFDCANPDGPAEQLGIKDGGCADSTEVMKATGGFGDMESLETCFCDTPLCNIASKKAFATFLGFLLILNIVI